ncbi:hypothetical protein BKA66DRAFT_444234 [Pyrenochaeta sp. MPI-SDFR-AT-0127]|nr:hypothetical protein BKA66DRAFT_444234 [Pyrenochaeta sp. MPI-SDFR-AT-0127]
MKFAAVFAAAIYATSASAWKINWYYTNGQHVESHGSSTQSGCINLRVNTVQLDRYVVDFATTLRVDPNRVRLWTGTGCRGNPTWDSTHEGNSNLVPNRIVKSYIIDNNRIPVSSTQFPNIIGFLLTGIQGDGK